MKTANFIIIKSSNSLAMITIICRMLAILLKVQQTCTSSSMLLIVSYTTWQEATASSNSTSTVLPAMAPPVAMEAQTLSSWMSDREMKVSLNGVLDIFVELVW
jgi:hypothetical protein